MSGMIDSIMNGITWLSILFIVYNVFIYLFVWLVLNTLPLFVSTKTALSCLVRVHVPWGSCVVRHERYCLPCSQHSLYHHISICVLLTIACPSPGRNCSHRRALLLAESLPREISTWKKRETWRTYTCLNRTKCDPYLKLFLNICSGYRYD